MLTVEVIIIGIVIAISLMSIIFSFGVVWRTEKELDLSYKFFLGAIIIFTISEFLELFSFEGRIVLENFILGSKLLFSILFLAGTLTARDLLRKMDGEKGIIPDDREKI
jgi:hypothetical protein